MKRLNHYSTAESKTKNFTAILFVIMLFAAFPFSKSFGNYITVANVSYSQVAGTVTFDIRWENGWRHSDWTAKNWDAAWVFVKWRSCDSAATSPFVHGQVSTTLGDHNFNVLSAASPYGLEPTDRYGNAPAIDAAPNNTGVMLRNVSDLTSGTDSSRVTLKLNNLPATGNLDFRIYGIEMVFVPQNPFILGDGNGYTTSSYSFTQTYAPTAPNIFPIVISSESNQPVYEFATNFCTGASGPPNTGCQLTASFQKGYNAFYVMKYEISQGQYADFLNATNSASQTVHYLSSTSNRYTITNTGTPPTQFGATRRYRAMSQLSWADASTFLDWAALRPLTELEYEKACRGTESAIAYQKAWGTPTGTNAAAISGTENGTETITTANANVNTSSTTFSGGDASSGPLRGGIYATASTSTRVQTGMGFYGAMELTGNVAEYYVSVAAGVNGAVSASGVALGDGVINASTGYQNVTTWPIATALSSDPGNVIIRRGGSWATSSGATSAQTLETNVSFRGLNNYTSTRDVNTGGRGGR